MQSENVAARLEQAGGGVLTPGQADAYPLTTGGLTPSG
ncbi:hypothetical protein EDD99_0896 [Streptomyces sp. 846.5]|nr:hypothetical protein EDD99_0896 [Streptomyces sp. 846.5]